MLDAFGKLAIVEIIAYIPLALVSFFVTLRYGFSRKGGWVLLLGFAIIRSLGAILTIVSEEESNPSSGILTAAGILQALGLSPLLLATHAFVTQLSDRALPNLSRILHLVRILIVVGIIFAVLGGIDQAPGNSASKMNSGHNLSKIGTALFLGGYIAIFGIHVLLWTVKSELPPVHRKFLRNISIALPFLAVRVAYSMLSAFNPPNSEFSTTHGKWQIYLVMTLIMEFIVVCIYMVSGLTIPLNDDASGSYDSVEPLQEMPWKPQQYYVRR